MGYHVCPKCDEGEHCTFGDDVPEEGEMFTCICSYCGYRWSRVGK